MLDSSLLWTSFPSGVGGVGGGDGVRSSNGLVHFVLQKVGAHADHCINKSWNNISDRQWLQPYETDR